MNTDANELYDILAESSVITAFPKEGCNGCGQCCSMFLPMTRREVKNIRKYIKKNGVRPIYQPVMCPFLDENQQCSVYEVRPMICRVYDCRKHKDLTLFADERLFDVKREIIDLGAEFCGMTIFGEEC